MKPYYQDESVTLYHGDCLAELNHLMADASHRAGMHRYVADVVITDPPYNAGKNYGDTTNDRMEWPLWAMWFDRVLRDCKDAAPNVFAFLSQTAAREYERLGAYPRDWCLVWNKPLSMAICASPFMPHWEPIFYWGQQKRTKDGGALWGSDVLTANVEVGTDRWGHPTPKPLKLMLEMVSKFDGVILDPFAGSGTTLEAAKHLGRTAIGIEINEEYCERIATRLSRTTPGIRAQMSQDGLFASGG